MRKTKRRESLNNDGENEGQLGRGKVKQIRNKKRGGKKKDMTEGDGEKDTPCQEDREHREENEQPGRSIEIRNE